MDKKQKRQTNEKAAIQYAAREEGFEGKSLLEEIALILPDYFLAKDIKVKEEAIEMCFFNGQTFHLKAEKA